MTDKRKNIDMIAPTYENGWLYRFARQRRWTREEVFVVNASPTACFEHLYGTPGRDRRYKYTIDAQDLDGEYEFRIQAQPRFTRSPFDVDIVVGYIVPDVGDEQKSFVTMRGYPAIKEIVQRVSFMIFWFGAVCVAMYSPEIYKILFALGAFTCVMGTLGYLTFGGRNKVLDAVRTLFTGDLSIAKPMAQKDKKDATL